MKQIFTILFFSSLLLTSYSQDYNLNFEQWDSLTNYTELHNWGTFNQLSAGGGIKAGAVRTTDAVSGNYALKLVTGSVPIGVAVLGQIYIASAVIKPGRPFALRPDSVQLFYKDSVVGGDSSAMVFIFTRWDIPTDTQKLVGRVIKKTYATISEYTYLSLPVEYLDSGMPDSMGIALAATGSPLGLGQEGNTLWIDSIHFSYTPTVIHAVPTNISIHFFPNPVHNKLLISAEQMLTENLYAEVYDENSRLVKHEIIFSSKTEIDISKLNAGIYYCAVLNLKGETLAVQKIMKQ
ncbi:MAG: T9SS type A sorting domain-containing protein [Bacteroidetes bacterium]|nr:T9SS type A sorting domain-containing protein [Bacteroidota bacterium]